MLSDERVVCRNDEFCIKHSQNECRCYVLGRTDENKKLFVVFTKRNNKIRVISARVMNKKKGYL